LFYVKYCAKICSEKIRAVRARGRLGNMEIDMTRLKELREDKALSIRELADMAGVSRTTVWNLERSGGAAHPRTIRKLSEALGVPPRELIKREE
jgi:predicted transcriptional regulator